MLRVPVLVCGELLASESKISYMLDLSVIGMRGSSKLTVKDRGYIATKVFSLYV